MFLISNVSIAGVDKYTQFSCEAHNQKGVTTSREANINIKGKDGASGGCNTFQEVFMLCKPMCFQARESIKFVIVFCSAAQPCV